MSGPAWPARAVGAAVDVIRAARDVVRADPPPTRVGGPLDGVNDAFHAGYDDARRDAELESPVFVMLGDALTVFHRGGRDEHLVVPRFVHVIKAAAHAPVALFAILEHRPRDRGAFGSTPIAALRRHVAGALQALGEDEDAAREPAARHDVEHVLAATLRFLEGAPKDHPDPSQDAELPAKRDRFTREMGPHLLRLTEHATRIQLDALHAATELALSRLDEAECDALQIVVAGDHQARARSLGMQYYGKRLGQTVDEGGEGGEKGAGTQGDAERVAYGEGVTSEEEALALVGRRRLDATMAKAFFGDAKRLQRDVLGDAAKAALAGMKLAPIGTR